MSPPTLILSPRHSADSHALRRAAVAAGWDVQRLPSWRAPEDFAPTAPVIYGEWLFCEVVGQALGIRYLDPPIDAPARLPPELRRREIEFTTLAAARRLDRPRFVKPADGKTFAARVYDDPAELPGPDDLPAETPVLVAEPVRWPVEYRCFVLDGRVVAVSPYWRGDETAWDPDRGWSAPDDERAAATTFAEEAVAGCRAWFPAAAVLDVGILEGRGWAVVEANPAYGSGLYGCDPDAVLPVVARACGVR